MKLDRDLSLFLDLLRFVAALAVVFAHLESDGLGVDGSVLSGFGREAVVIFFVMSGYIITTTTLVRNRGPVEYAVARASRIYSVALPAIVLSIGAAWIAQWSGAIDETALSHWRAPAWQDILSSLFFLNESLGNAVTLTLNDPYWSLCYEVWYYLLFGWAIYVRGAARWIGLAVLCALAGPGIMVLSPLWIAGALLTVYAGPRRMSRALAWALFTGGFTLVWAINATGLEYRVQEIAKDMIPGFWRLYAGQRMFTDYIVGIGVVVSLIAYPHLGGTVPRLLGRMAPVIRYGAGFSFSLYLLHRPFTQIGGQLLPNETGSMLHMIVAATIVTAICAGLSYGTERTLPVWRKGFGMALRRVAPGARTSDDALRPGV